MSRERDSAGIERVMAGHNNYVQHAEKRGRADGATTAAAPAETAVLRRGKLLRAMQLLVASGGGAVPVDITACNIGVRGLRQGSGARSLAKDICQLFCSR